MRNSLRAALAAIAFGLVFSSTVVLAQDTQRKPRILGGYSRVATDDADVQQAAEFAVKAQGEKQEATINLTSIERAEKQSVAGTNFKLCLQIEIEGGDEGENVSQQVSVVVHRNLQQEYSLKSWAEAECSGSESDGHHARARANMAGVYEKTASAKTAGAEESSQKRAGARWEYCALSRAGYTGSSRGGLYWLSYFKEAGAEIVEIEEKVSEQPGAAVAKAIAKLGEEGWEMVASGELPVKTGRFEAIYFKRQKQ